MESRVSYPKPGKPYKVSYFFRFAHKAKMGDCVISTNEDGKLFADEIVKIGRKVSKGIYSPMTVEGALVANDVLASCFSHIESHSIQKLAYDFLVRIYDFFGYMPSISFSIRNSRFSLVNIHYAKRYPKYAQLRA